MDNKLPHPTIRKTIGVFSTTTEALQEGRSLMTLMRGLTSGFKMGVFERMNAFVLLRYTD